MTGPQERILIAGLDDDRAEIAAILAKAMTIASEPFEAAYAETERWLAVIREGRT